MTPKVPPEGLWDRENGSEDGRCARCGDGLGDEPQRWGRGEWLCIRCAIAAALGAQPPQAKRKAARGRDP